jgi:hypothetical protein
MTNAAILDPAGEPITRDSLWATLEAFLHAAFNLFGTPIDLAEKAWLRIAEYKRVRDWLFRCEELFRRVLYIDARALSVEAKPPATRRSKARKHASFDPEFPNTWRCGFSLHSSGPPASSRHLSKRKPPNAWPTTTACAYGLAQRYEALIRAWNNRERLVRRMARLLQKLPLIGKLFAQPTRTYAQQKPTSGDFSVADAATYIRETDSS